MIPDHPTAELGGFATITDHDGPHDVVLGWVDRTVVGFERAAPPGSGSTR
ncbi:hypothetical protein [Polymorphospora sp. NPDC050346]